MPEFQDTLFEQDPLEGLSMQHLLVEHTPAWTTWKPTRGKEISLSKLQDRLGEELLIALYREVCDPSVVAYFIVPGEPESKARARWNARKGGRPFTTKQTQEAELKIAWMFRQSAGPVVPDKKSSFGVFASFVRKTHQRRDVDNMVKLVMDALTGVAWVDDSQVTEISAKSRTSNSEPRSHIVIYRTLSQLAPQGRCVVCGLEFNIYPSTQGRKFCSRECTETARRTGETVACQHCGQPFYRKEEHRKAGTVHCSIQCRAASDHRRVTQPCPQCGEPVRLAQSVAEQKRPYCSQECQIAWAKAHPSTARGGGICGTCGRKTSRREYTRCRACSVASQTKRI